MWTLGTKNPLDTVTELQNYTLAGVAQRIKSDVLILAGVEDHFVPIEQVAQIREGADRRAERHDQGLRSLFGRR
jgi:hypothetical protein